ncbi:ABC transporter ATP-binding protein [Acidithiobacillus thiooxidans]|uniref:ABC transporter ATP-binding protein n=1 Tax=Acidithiobacillus thiooxidans TaxID=930 RepID=UPI002862A20E|nr:ABC transporter ATP-binding protein [Acidithiobacillus thiooxidans]MDR7926763.1 ABC transporter ATP-binding protein [Acidithiobacillus thiooxidans]
MFSIFEGIIKIFDGENDLNYLKKENKNLLDVFYNYTKLAKKSIALLVISATLLALGDLSIPFIIGYLVNIVSNETTKNINIININYAIYIAIDLLIYLPVVNYLHFAVINQSLEANLTNLIRWRNHAGVIRQGLPFFNNDLSGKISNRVMQVGAAVEESIVSSVSSVWYLAIYGVITFFTLFYNSMILSIPTALWLIIYFFILKYFLPILANKSKEVSTARSNLSGALVDTYNNIRTVKLFSSPDKEDELVKKHIKSHTDKFHASLRTMTALTVSIAVINSLLLFGTIFFSIILWLNNLISVSIVVASVPLVWQITNMSTVVSNSILAIFRHIGTILDGIKSVDVSNQNLDDASISTAPKLQGSIKFENVYFNYYDIKNNENISILNDISFTVDTGEKVAFVGESGSGKSTILDLILKLYNPYKGNILFDNINSKNFSEIEIRKSISVVSQDTSLMNRSILDNIKLGKPDASFSEINEALRLSGAFNFIEKLEDSHGRKGLEAFVGERGLRLSGGQRQRIGIARALIKNSKIFLFDEATSALDSQAELEFYTNLLESLNNVSILSVAHRLSTIKDFDKILVLSNGRIIESGTHSELVLLNGMYNRMWQIQTGMFTSTEPSVSYFKKYISD